MRDAAIQKVAPWKTILLVLNLLLLAFFVYFWLHFKAYNENVKAHSALLAAPFSSLSPEQKEAVLRLQVVCP